MKPARFRTIPLWRAAVILVLGTALLSALFLPARIPELDRVTLDPRPEIEVMLAVGLVAFLALLGRRLPAALRWIIAGLLTVTALFHLVATLVPGSFERELDLYWDLPHVPRLIGLFLEAAGPVKGWLAVIAVALGAVALVAAIAGLFALMERALRGHYRAAGTLGLVALALVLIPIHRSGGEAYVSTRLAAEIGHHGKSVWRSWRIMHGETGAYSAALAEPQPKASDLGKLRHRDVYLVFFESYGTTVLDDPQFAPSIAPALAEFEESVKEAGYYLASNRIVSPTFGGGSWLAHGTMASGLKLDQVLYRLLLSTDRRTLPEYMKAAGYATLDIMPGLKSPWPEGDYWGFDRTITAKDLGYAGPSFGWFDIPDQYTLKTALERIDAKPHPPVFTQIVLVSSHTPFAPVPPYVEDWSDAGPYKSVSQAEWDRIYTNPDWWHLEEPYLQSVKYDLTTLAGWLAQLKGQPLIIILGDHQPPGFVSGAQAPHTVPIHVLSRDPDLVLPFTARGYVAGAVPPKEGDFEGMEDFLPEFLTLFASDHDLASRD